VRWLSAIVFCVSLQGGWLRMKSPHFELYTNAGERAGRQTLRRLEEIRHVFQEWATGRAAPLPVRVFVYGGEREFRAYGTGRNTRGFYQGGPDGDSIVMVSGEESYRVLFHEYVHLVLHHSSAALPQWMEEGTAEFYSTLEANGERLLVGRVIAAHVRALSSDGWLSGAQLAAVGRDSEYYNEQDKAGVFYAQSWALMHMLNLSARYRKNLPRFAELLDEGEPAGAAFEKAFGRSLEEALGDLKAYVGNRRFGIAEVYWRPPPEVETEVSALSEEEAELAQVELLLRVGRAGEAEKRLKKLPAEGGEVLTALGLFHLSQKRNQEALGYLKRAMEAGAPANAYFEYAMLLREEGAEAAEVDRYLREAVGRNPKHAEAQFVLGLRASQQGRHEEAVGWLEQAVAVLPRQSYFWHALAYSYHELGRGELARRAARKAADSAGTPHELEMAKGVMKLTAGSEVKVAAAVKPSVRVPESWKMPQGDARVEGMLEHIDCFGQAARFQVRVEGKPVLLWVEKPGEVLLKTASAITFEFRCGAQRPRAVAVEYEVRPDEGRKTAGEIRAIEFR
jgi:tetratricopeptide (TPR) repeat protein